MEKKGKDVQYTISAWSAAGLTQRNYNRTVKAYKMIRKVAVIGPESTGKSTLCRQLAAHYQTMWVPEYARDYLQVHGTPYTYENLLEIAKGQVALEEEYLDKLKPAGSQAQDFDNVYPDKPVPVPGYAPSALQHKPDSPETVSGKSAFADPVTAKTFTYPLLFVDTEMYVMKVWSEFVFGKCHQWIIDQIVERKYDLYLLCNIDLPWSYDVLREYPNEEPRQKLFRMYHDILVNQTTPWAIVSGDNQQRVSQAIAAINRML